MLFQYFISLVRPGLDTQTNILFHFKPNLFLKQQILSHVPKQRPQQYTLLAAPSSIVREQSSWIGPPLSNTVPDSAFLPLIEYKRHSRKTAQILASIQKKPLRDYSHFIWNIDLLAYVSSESGKRRVNLFQLKALVKQRCGHVCAHPV